MSDSLPERPDLDHLRRQAKELRDGARRVHPKGPSPWRRPSWSSLDPRLSRPRKRARPHAFLNGPRTPWLTTSSPLDLHFRVAPSAGLEPAHPAPEADALSAELRGRASETTGCTHRAGGCVAVCMLLVVRPSSLLP